MIQTYFTSKNAAKKIIELNIILIEILKAIRDETSTKPFDQFAILFACKKVVSPVLQI